MSAFRTANMWVILLVVAASVILLPPPIRACSVPVFQYALAYWTADPYEVIVFHRGPISSEEQVIVDRLQRASWDTDPRANVAVKTVDLAGSPGVVMQKLWESQAPGSPSPKSPWIVVRYPRFSRVLEDVWSGPLTTADVEALLDSPLRKEVARRILKGEAAVWVFLESGDQQQDEAAARLLETQLEKMSENLRILVPEGSAVDLSEADLRVKFSMVRLSRDDETEAMLIRMLLNTEWDLKMLSKPMAFPIFGRGRVLYALVGDGIRESNIKSACSFLVGWCSCVVKEQNPGVDLLMSLSWDDMISDELYEETRILLRASESITAAGEGTSALRRNISVVVLAQLLIVAAVACVVLWRRKQRT